MVDGFVREDEMARYTWPASHRVRVWITTRFQKTETGHCHNTMDESGLVAVSFVWR